jgi:hypothetical protein
VLPDRAFNWRKRRPDVKITKLRKHRCRESAACNMDAKPVARHALFLSRKARSGAKVHDSAVPFHRVFAAMVVSEHRHRFSSDNRPLKVKRGRPPGRRISTAATSEKP